MATTTIYQRIHGVDEAYVCAEDTVQWIQQAIDGGLLPESDQPARNALTSAKALRAWVRTQAEAREAEVNKAVR